MRNRNWAVLLALLFGASTFLQAGSQETNGAVKLHWTPGRTIRYTFNSNFAPNNNNDLVRAAIRDAFTSLMNAMGPSPAVRFEEANPASTTVNTSAVDGINLITFTSGQALPSGVIAQARVFFSGSTGEIGEVDMLFNNTRQFRTNSRETSTFDVQAIGLHEGGHWLGLGHSGILAAIMSPFGDSGEFPARELQTDDILALRSIYGPASGRSIRGLVSMGGSPVKGAHVVATDSATGLTHASTFSEADGTYRIPILTSGSYRLFVEPLDGPVRPSNVPDAFSGGVTDFQTAFLANAVSVSADVTGVNIPVTAGATANSEQFGVFRGNSAQVSGAPSSVTRGTDATIAIGGSNIPNFANNVRFSSPKISLRGTRTQSTFVFADITIAPDAAVGPADIYVGSTVFTGGIVIAASPAVPANGVVDAAAFNQNTTGPHYAPGSMISIFGTDVAEFQAAASAIPLPTQLGGISVEIGGRLAPLFFVSPTQVNAMIPYETTGSSTTVKVLAGPNSESAPITLQLGTSTPRAFQLNSQGDGAIQNNSRSFQTVTAGTPAAAGDVITIYLTGMGAVQGTLATGLASPSQPPLSTTVTPTVTIGGQNAELFFSGLTPGLVGLYQVTVRVPAGLAAGKQPVVVRSTNGSSNTVFTYVR